MIMHKSNSRCNPQLEKIFAFFRPETITKIATLEKILSPPNLRSRNQNDGLDTVE